MEGLRKTIPRVNRWRVDPRAGIESSRLSKNELASGFATVGMIRRIQASWRLMGRQKNCNPAWTIGGRVRGGRGLFSPD